MDEHAALAKALAMAECAATDMLEADLTIRSLPLGAKIASTVGIIGLAWSCSLVGFISLVEGRYLRAAWFFALFLAFYLLSVGFWWISVGLVIQ